MDGYGKRVLVADDDQDECNLLSIVLENAGYRVHMASDGREAVEDMQRRRFDVVLADHYLPKINGFQFLLLGRLIWPDTPMILLSRDDASLSEIAQHRGAYGSLRKPYDSGKLLELVAHAIQSTQDVMRDVLMLVMQEVRIDGKCHPYSDNKRPHVSISV